MNNFRISEIVFFCCILVLFYIHIIGKALIINSFHDSRIDNCFFMCSKYSKGQPHQLIFFGKILFSEHDLIIWLEGLQYNQFSYWKSLVKSTLQKFFQKTQSCKTCRGIYLYSFIFHQSFFGRYTLPHANTLLFKQIKFKLVLLILLTLDEMPSCVPQSEHIWIHDNNQ